MPRGFLAIAAVGLLLCVMSCTTANHNVDITEAKELFFANKLSSARPLLQQAYDAAPGNAEVCCYLAETCRRLGQIDEAVKYASEALDSQPCNAFAHTVLASAYEPMWSSWDGTSDDICWSHALAAVECDSLDGNAWLVIWAQALKRGDSAKELDALRALRQTNFFSQPVIEYNRWVLNSLPENSLLLTSGDLDTYPAVMLQQVDRIRPDVVIANLSLLNTDWYDQYLNKSVGLPLPLPAGVDQNLRSKINGKEIVSPAMQRINAWIELKSAGQLTRPILLATTARPENLPPELRDKVSFAGAYFTIGDAALESAELADALGSSFDSVDLTAFDHPVVSQADRSPVRRTTSHFCAMNICEVGIRLCEALREKDDLESAGRCLETVKSLAVRSGVEAKFSEKIKAVEASLQS